MKKIALTFFLLISTSAISQVQDTLTFKRVLQLKSPPSSTALPGQLRIFEADAQAGVEYVAIRVPVSLTSSYTIILPIAAPSAGNVFTAITSDSMGWSTPSGSGDITGVTAGTSLGGGGTSGDVTLNLLTSPRADHADTLTIRDLISGIPNTNDFVKWDGTNWVPAAAGAGSGDIEGVTAGINITGGGTSGTVTINADTSAGNTKLGTQGDIDRAIAALSISSYQQDSDTTTWDATKTYVNAQGFIKFADSTSNFLQTKFENQTLHPLKTLTLTAGDGLSGGGDLSTNRSFDIKATDGVKVLTDSVRLQLGSASGLEIVSGVSALDSLRIDIDGSTLSRTSAGLKVASGGITATEIGTDAVSADELNATGVEAELEAVLDLNELQGQIGDAQIADGAIDGGLGGEVADNSITADDINETVAYALSSTSNTFSGLVARLDTLRIIGNGGIRANDDTLYFRKGDGSIGFRLVLSTSPATGQVVKSVSGNIMTFQADATSGGGSGNFRLRDDGNSISSSPASVDFRNGLQAIAAGVDSLEVFIIGTDGIKSDADSLRILLASLSGLAIKTGAGTIDSLRADSTSWIASDYSVSLRALKTITLTAGNALVGGGDISTNRTFDVVTTDGIKVLNDSLRLQLRTDSGLLIKAGVGALDSLAVDSTRYASVYDVSLKANSAITLTAGDGLSGGGDLSTNRSFATNLDFDGAIEITDDSLNVKLDGTSLAKSASGLKANQNAGTDITADLEEETHATEHQDTGADEISVTGLSGLLADPQKFTVKEDDQSPNSSVKVISFNSGEVTITADTAFINIAASGDITSVGDVASGAAFDGTQGTILTFNNAGGDGTFQYDGTVFAASHALTVQASDPADAEAIRFDNNEGIAWEASPAGTDVTLKVDASEILQASGTLNAATLTEGANAVPNATDHLGFFAATTSAQLAGVLSDETGSGVAVFGTSPTIADALLNNPLVNGGSLELNDGSGDSPSFLMTPQTGASWSWKATDSDDDAELSVNTASTENLDIINLGAGVTNLTVDGAISGSNLSGTNTGDQTITLTTDVTGSGTGSFATTIANDAVTNAKAANMAQNTIKMRVASGSGDPEDIDISAGLTTVTPVSGDFIIIEDATDGGLKKVDASNFLGGGGALTVEEADASPTVSSVAKVQFDQTDGFTVTDETGGQIQVDLVNAPDAAVANTITLDNITQITTRAHASLSSLTADDHTIYLLLAGRAGGQGVDGGTASGNDLSIRSTSHATKGEIALAYDGGDVTIGGGTTASNLTFLEPSGSGTNVSKFSTVAQSADITYKLPPTVGSAGTQLTDVAGDGVLTWAAAGGAGSPFQTTSNVANLVTSTDDVTFGSATSFGKFAIDGDANETQFHIQGNGTQTAPLMLAENSSGTDLFSLSNTGVATMFESVEPSAPSANYSAYYNHDWANANSLTQLRSSGLSQPFQRSMWRQQIFLIEPLNSSNWTAIGSTASAVGGTITTPANPTETEGWMTNILSASAATASVGTNATIFIRGSSATGASGFFYYSRAYFPDASYAAVRGFAGMTNASSMTTVLTADNAAGHHVGWQYSTTRSDAGWKFMTKDGTTQSVSAATLNFTAQHVYEFMFFCEPGGSTIYYQINDLTAATTASGSTASNLPGASTNMRAGVGIDAISGTKNIKIGKVYVEVQR